MLKGHHRSTPCWCEEALDGSVPRALLTKQRPQRVHGATHLHSVRASCWGRRLIFHCSAKIKMSVCNNFDDGGAQHPKRHTHTGCIQHVKQQINHETPRTESTQ